MNKEKNLFCTEEEINPIFEEIRKLVTETRDRVYSTVNVEMLKLYWNIGKIIMEIQQGEERASYGDTLLENLSKKGILVKNIPYEVIMTKTVYMGSTGVKLKVIYKNSAGVDIPLYSEIKFNVEKQLSSDETVDLLIDPDDYSNYFIDFEIY